MKWKKLLLEPRIIFVAIILFLAIVAMKPAFERSEDGTYDFKTGIKKGLDLEGGVRALILPQDQQYAEQVSGVLNARISAFGLQEKVIRLVEIEGKKYVEVELAGSSEEQLKHLIEKQGNFDARISQNILLDADDEGILKIGEQQHAIKRTGDNKIEINENMLEFNHSTEINNIKISFVNKTSGSVSLSAIVFDGTGIKDIFRDAQNSRVYQAGANQWQFVFTILLSKDAATNFHDVVRHISLDSQNPQYLSSNIELYLDGSLMDSLRIGSSLQSGIQTQVQISGPGSSQEDAATKMKELQSILESGALPTQIEIVQTTSVSPTLGKQFVKLSIISIFASILVVSLIIFIRYRDPRIVIPIILTSVMEVILIFGMASLIRWTIDLASIAGILAAIGTGVDNQIVIADETLQKKKVEASLKERMKSAFFIIFSSSATVAAAMLPLMTIGAGAVRGFAFTTLMGVLIGVLITRPAFAKVVEYIKQEDSE